jgi:phosphoribosyl-dephospho-CoA transferase
MAPKAAPAVHSLLRVVNIKFLEWDATPPAWITESLQRAPFVVVRRALERPRLVPVGVRGMSRSQRAAAWLPENAIDECITPQMLAATRAWRKPSDSIITPAIAVLDAVDAIFAERGLTGLWGPTGSAGFELASGVTTTHVDSDLDLVLDANVALARTGADRLHRALSALPIRIDLQLETPQGAVLLAEFVNGSGVTLLRSVHGPRMVSDPWGRSAGESRT